MSNYQKKIISLKDVVSKIKSSRNKKEKIGLSHGVFDLLHLGHVTHFNEAKKKVDILIVSVTSDQNVSKGPGRPVFNHLQRMEMISNLETVDYVVLSETISSSEVINLIKPDIYFKGPDYKDNSKDFTKKIIEENNLVKKMGGSTYYTSSKKYSSTDLLQKFQLVKKKNSTAINKIKKKFSFDKIKNLIDDLQKIKPLVLGEVIIDQYVFCEALGKSGKEPTLVLRDLNEELYLGGAGAIANHLSSFCKKTQLLSLLGQNKDKIKFIKKNLKSGINLNYIEKKNSPTIIKKRYLDRFSKYKLLGVYTLNDKMISNQENKNLTKKFLSANKKTDLTILSDYGHGFINKKFAREVIKKSKFIAVNAQINASNFSHHSLDYYKNIDFMIINESELRHEMRERDKDVFSLTKNLSKKLNIKYLAVTRGSEGAILYHGQKKLFYNTVAYTNNVIDKVGAGDAMLSILSICLFKKIDIDLSLLISSFCAVQSVKTVGNKSSLSKSSLLKDIFHFLA